MTEYKVENNIDDVIRTLEGNSKENVLRATIVWHESVVETLTGTRTGRQYRIPASKQFYRASNPNEPPASRTGRLRTSYQFRTVQDGLIGEVGSPLVYAMHLEKGTKRMAPRPHLEPAYLKREKEIKEILGGRLDE